MDYFNYKSSPIDWCERNYEVVSSIAEFYNTVSNAAYFIIPPISIYLFQEYGRVVTKGVHLIFAMLMLVGAGSVYFHSTLSLAGQLMDELFILWVLLGSYAMLFPNQYLPGHFQRNRNQFSLLIMIICLLLTSLCCYHPYLNAFFLLGIILPVMVVLVNRIKGCKEKRILKLFKRTVFLWVVSITLWILDRTSCAFLIHYNLNYFHSTFHILALISAQWTAVLFLYFTALDKAPENQPSIGYWLEKDNRPMNKINVFIPYVYFAKYNENISEIIFKND